MAKVNQVVKLNTHNELHNDYYGLTGVVTEVIEEPEIKRTGSSNEPTPTGNIITLHRVVFNVPIKKEMTKSLLLEAKFFQEIKNA